EGNRVRIQTGRHQTGDVRHVDEQQGTDLVGDGAETGEVQHPRVGRETGDDHLWLVLDCQALDLVIIDQAVLVDAVLHGVVQLAGGGDLGAVGQVTAVGQAHAEDGVTGIEQREVHRAVGGR